MPGAAADTRVLVLGSGVMGMGVARLFAGAGMPVTIHRHSPKPGLQAPEGATIVTELPAEAPALVVENVYERMDVKVPALTAVQEKYGESAIYASNTSGLPLEDIAAALPLPGRFVGMHFFTPADVSPLVEVVRTSRTDDATLDAAVAVLATAGREALLISKPVVGYLWNRLQHAILHEAYHIIEAGIASAEDIDKVAKRLFGPRFCVAGLIESKDIGGLQVHADAQDSIVPNLHHEPRTSGLLRRLVENGDVGILAGRGFYDWEGRDPKQVADSARRKLSRLNRFLAEEMAEGEPDLSPGPSRRPE